jgi:hypothetical protein
MSGVRIGTPSTTVALSGFGWTVKPHAGILDLETAVEASAYWYAVDANVTGTVSAAHATYARVDILTVKLDDPSESDGSSVPAVTVNYTAGTASGSPVAPATPARSMVLATIAVPASGGGNPVSTWAANYCAAAGAIVPVRDNTHRGVVATALAPTADNPLYVHNKAQAAGTELQRTIDGTTWVTFDARDTGWITPSLSAGWVSSGFAYRKIGSQLFFKGELYGGTLSTTIFTLPPGHRPASRVYTSVYSLAAGYAQPGEFYVQDTGVVWIRWYNGGAASPGLGMGTISFLVD